MAGFQNLFDLACSSLISCDVNEPFRVLGGSQTPNLHAFPCSLVAQKNGRVPKLLSEGYDSGWINGISFNSS